MITFSEDQVWYDPEEDELFVVDYTNWYIGLVFDEVCVLPSGLEVHYVGEL